MGDECETTTPAARDSNREWWLIPGWPAQKIFLRTAWRLDVRTLPSWPVMCFFQF